MPIARWNVVPLVLGLLACSGGADGDSDRGNASTAAGQNSAGAGGGASGNAGDQPGDFGNPNGGPREPLVAPMEDGGVAMSGDGGRCAVGQFCGPNSPDPDNCGTIKFAPDVEVTRTPGNVVIVFDQSLSMEMDWPGTGMSKLAAAQSALVAAITPLQDEVTVAAVFLPTATCFTPLDEAFQGNAVPAIDDPSQINFMPGPAFLGAWDSHWAGFVGGQLIGTPLQEGFDRAEEAIAAARMNMLLAGTGQVAVVAFTDGEPNCVPVPDFTGRPTMEMAPRAADWLTQSIKTYVVGLPGADQGAMTLNSIANAGGTMQFISPTDPAALEAKLREVVQETVSTGFNSCSINLDPVPDVPDKLQLIVEDNGALASVPRDFGPDAGWTLDDQGHVEITGTLCDDAMTGRFASITFEYACPNVPPPPPLKPPE